MAPANCFITCECCGGKFNSIETAREHLQDLRNHVKSFEDQLLNQIPSSGPISASADRKRNRRYLKKEQCDICGQTLTGVDSLKRHGWTRMTSRLGEIDLEIELISLDVQWGRPCDECNESHKLASIYISHKCASGENPRTDTRKVREQFLRDQLSKQHQGHTTIEASSTRATAATRLIEATDIPGAIETNDGREEGIPYQGSSRTNNPQQSLWQSDWDNIEQVIFDLHN